MVIDLLIVNSIKRALLYDNGARKSNIMKKYQGCKAGVGANGSGPWIILGAGAVILDPFRLQSHIYKNKFSFYKKMQFFCCSKYLKRKK